MELVGVGNFVCGFNALLKEKYASCQCAGVLNRMQAHKLEYKKVLEREVECWGADDAID